MTVQITQDERERIRKDFDKFTAEIIEAHHPLGPPLPEPPKVVYCMSIYEERMDQVKRCVEQVRPYVDRCVIVVDDSVTAISKDWLNNYGCAVYYRKWENHFSKQRNEYLAHINDGEWVLVSDPDELHSESLMQDIHAIIENADRRGINLLGINSHDILTTIEGKKEENISDFFKNLLFKYEEGVRYAGVVHETLLPGPHGWRPANLDKRYYYEHYKLQSEVWERAARNFHIVGGGNNLREKNPIWPEYRKRIEQIDAHLLDWPTMREYLRKGNINQSLKNFLITHRNRNRIPDADTEIREYFRYYFEVLHPEENMESWKSQPEEPPKGSWGDVRNYVEETYMKILGRHADEGGKEFYTQAILQGKIKREDLPKIFETSSEYKQKFGVMAEPISVGAIVLAKNEEKQIKTCLQHLRPYVDFLLVVADSKTSDKTIEIAKDIADAVLVRPFSGSFAEERNYAQCLMATNWVLHCDCDETFNEDFLKNMKKLIGHSGVKSFRFPRLNPEKRDWPDYQVRLINKDDIEWRGKFSEAPYHKGLDKPIDQVSIKTLEEHPIIHFGKKKDWAKLLQTSNSNVQREENV